MVDTILKGNEDRDQIKELLNMVEGDNCYPKLLVFFLFWFAMAYFSQLYRSRYL